MAVSQLKNLFQTSLESHEEDAPAVIGGEDSMEAAVLDVQTSYHELASIEEDQMALEQIYEGLEQVHASMEASLQEGGLDPIAADLARLAVAGQTERLGLEVDDVMPSLESFGGDSGKQSATTVSMEAVTDTLKKIWNAIKAAVEKAIKAVTDFFSRVFNGVNKMRQRLNALEKDVKGAESMELKKDAKVKVSSPNSVQLEGKVDAASLLKGMDNLTTVNGEMFGEYLDKVPSYYETVGNVVSKNKEADDDSKAEEAEGEIKKAAEDVVKSVTKSYRVTLPGDKTLVDTSTTKGDSSKTSVQMESVKGAKAFAGSNEIAPLSASQMADLVSKCQDVMENIQKGKDAVTTVSKAREDAMKQMKEVADASDSNKLGKIWAKAKGQALLRFAQRDLMKPITQITSYDFSVCRTMVGVVESSLKQYEEKGSE